MPQTEPQKDQTGQPVQAAPATAAPATAAPATAVPADQGVPPIPQATAQPSVALPVQAAGSAPAPQATAPALPLAPATAATVPPVPQAAPIPVSTPPAAPSSNGAASQKATDQALTKINRDIEEKRTAEHAKELNFPFIDVGGFPINPDILHLISPEDAKRGMLMVFYKSGKKLRVAVADPRNPQTQEILQGLQAKGFEVQMNLASAAGVSEAFRLYASDQYKLKTEIKNVVQEGEIHYEKELENLAKLKDKIASLPSEEALNTLSVSAIKAGASDIHYQPEEDQCTIRFRIDGVLHPVFDIGKEVYANLSNQLKYKSGMKLNITNVPQDGRFRFIVNERRIDVRVSSIPTEYGESFVCRILDSGKHFATFAELGFAGRSLDILTKASDMAQGMVLVTGPTGSGKTTSLYVLLTQLNTQDTKIITLEDPIEYHLRGITQSQINEKRGYNFAAGLRSILRQDPDVVMIGEIRDLETAEVSAQAALTGHILLSTLHTNSAVETIPRLINLGLPTFMVAPAISVIVAQRLVRRLCGKCPEERAITPEEKASLEKMLQDIKVVEPANTTVVPEKLKVAKGCEECNGTGFRGQMIVSEVLQADDEVKQAVLKNATSSEILILARKKGMLTIREDAMLKVFVGMTTIDEVYRVTNA